MENVSDSDTNCNWCALNDPQRLGKEAERVGYRWAGRDYPIYNVSKICYDTEKSSENLMRFAVTQTPVKDYQLTLMWKNLQGVNNIGKKNNAMDVLNN